jgi:hypothetical protein
VNSSQISLAAVGALTTIRVMFSHIVVFWTVPLNLGAADELEKYVRRLVKKVVVYDFE